MQLRELREHAGRPSYRQLAQLAHYSHTALSQAAAGRTLPSLAVTLAFVRACGGDVEEWSARWHETDRAARLALESEQKRSAREGAEGTSHRRIRSVRPKRPRGIPGWQAVARWLRAMGRIMASGIAVGVGIAAVLLWTVHSTSVPEQNRPGLHVQGSGLYIRYAVVANLGTRAGYAYVINTGAGRLHRSPQPVRPGQSWAYFFNRGLKDGTEICGSINLGPATCAIVHRRS